MGKSISIEFLNKIRIVQEIWKSTGADLSAPLRKL